MSTDVAALGRTFERFPADGSCHQIKQVPPEVSLPTFEIKHADLHLRFDIDLSLMHLGFIDAGVDHFRVTLSCETPARWQGETHGETLIVRRAFVNLTQVVSWVRRLEPAIEAMLYTETTHSPHAPDQAAARLLLRVVDYLEVLRPQLAQQSAQRSLLLGR